MNYDLTIIGNGIIGSIAAFQTSKKFPDLNIRLIGPKSRNGSASLAAGAMLNVFGEIDYSKIK